MKQSECKNRFPLFKERFTRLRGDRSNTEFAEFLGMSRQTVGFYINGERIPDILVLKQIAIKCGVSADYLVGLTDNPSPNPQIQEVCEYTGLTPKAAEILGNCKRTALLPLISKLIEQEEWIAEIDNAPGSLVLSKIRAYLEIDRNSPEVYQILPGEIEKKKSSGLIIAEALQNIPFYKLAEDAMLREISRALEVLKDICAEE